MSTSIEQNHKGYHFLNEASTNKGSNKKLVGKLIYLSYVILDIAYAVNVVGQFMHDPQKSHMDVVEHILKYLKSTPGKGLLVKKHNHLNVEGYSDED